jgi:glucosamine--fructose-6-phosphate aminotransferase (isomerizing)
MCGIVAYVGSKPCQNLLIEGIKRLEYRGYDSSGIATIHNGKLQVVKAVGRVSNLEDKLEAMGGLAGTVGMVHTRWATHGGVTDVNCHPHIDDKAGIAVVHNGIIENHVALRRELEGEGVVFASQTDTEVIPHLLAKAYDGKDPVKALRCE